MPTPDAITVPRELLEALLDPDPCWFDRNGGCQAHGYLSLDQGEVCPVEEAKLRLNGTWHPADSAGGTDEMATQ